MRSALVTAAVLLTSAAAHADELWAGVAVEDITPPTNRRMADNYYVRPAGDWRKPELPKNGESDPADRLAVGVRGTA